MTGAFRFTTGRWFNKPTEDGLSFAKAPAYHSGFTYEGFEYGKDYPQEFEPGQPVQQSLLCSPSTRLLAIDVDRPEELPGSATGDLVSWSDAASTRGSHFHVLVDMRGVEPEDWPAQGVTAWGDVKAAGFVPVPGSVHYTGAKYEEAVAWQDKVVKATPELAAALRRDREDHALRRLAAARERMGLGGGTRLPDGSYLYSSGYAGGTWNDLPDGYLQHDDLLKDLVWDMHVTYGRPEEEVRETWDRLAGALTSAWTDRDWARHWKRVPARRAEVLENDDTYRLMEDFGLKLLPPKLEQEYARQREDYERRSQEYRESVKVSADTFPPTPVPDDGPWEDPNDPGEDLFDWNLGVGQYARPFDAGSPNDSDNARAVLRRIGGVAAYLTDRGVWLKRTGARWDDQELGANLKPVLAAVEEVMPKGCLDPVKLLDMDEDTMGPEIAALKAQAKNLERFKTSSARSSIAVAAADTAIRYSGRGLSTQAALLDTEPEILWAGGVPWDLRQSGEVPVRAALDRNAPHVMSAAVVPDPSGPHRLWDAFKAALLPDGPGDNYPGHAADWALNVLAVSFTGYSDAVMPVLMGDPGRGKTHLVKRLIEVLGGNAPWSYGGVMESELLRSDAKLHGTFTLALKGKRLAFVDEAPGHGMAAQRRLKSLTGGGALQGNKMRENPVSFAPTHTLVMTANHEDPPPMDEPALQRRLRLVFFEGDVTEVEKASEAVDGSVEAREEWRRELPYVLAEMMRRAAAWLADRHIADADRAPDRWRFKTADEVQTQDPVLAWLDAGEIVPDPAGTRASLLRANFVDWCKGQGKVVPTETKWGRRLTELGFPVSGRDAGGRYRPLKIILPGAAQWMQGPPSTATLHETLQPENSQFRGGSLYSLYGLNSSNNYSHKENPDTPPQVPPSHIKRKGENPAPYTDPSGTPSDLGMHGLVHGTQTLHDGALPSTEPDDEAEPVVPNKTSGSKIGENAQNGQNPTSPPKAKTPRARLSDEEKQARADARKAKLAEERAAAKRAKVAEIGGRLVRLPAIVLRDQTILEVSADTCRAWLEPSLGELAVDVENSAFPAGHAAYALRLVQVGTEGFAAVFDPSDEEQADVIRWALENAVILHAHSAHADLVPLERAGLGDRSMWGKMLDTVHIAKLLDPSLTDSDEAALKPLGKNVLGESYALSWRCDEVRKKLFTAGGWLTEVELDTPLEKSGWLQVPFCEAFVRYAASDVMDCAAVWRVLSERNASAY